MVYPNKGAVVYEFNIPWSSIRMDNELYLNKGFTYNSKNNYIRLSHIKSSDEIATINVIHCYLDDVDYINKLEIWVYYR